MAWSRRIPPADRNRGGGCPASDHRRDEHDGRDVKDVPATIQRARDEALDGVLPEAVVAPKVKLAFGAEPP